jgi:phenylalanine-4-hydroxylase
LGDELLFDPSWGDFDMAVGSEIPSVFGGPADRTHYGQTEDFAAKRVPGKNFSQAQLSRHAFFKKLRDLRGNTEGAMEFSRLVEQYLTDAQPDWLQGIELLELANSLKSLETEKLKKKLQTLPAASAEVKMSIQDGIELAAVRL